MSGAHFIPEKNRGLRVEQFTRRGRSTCPVRAHFQSNQTLTRLRQRPGDRQPCILPRENLFSVYLWQNYTKNVVVNQGKKVVPTW